MIKSSKEKENILSNSEESNGNSGEGINDLYKNPWWYNSNVESDDDDHIIASKT